MADIAETSENITVEEILENYQVDGIHFDDYFYPNLDIDNENYLEYSKHNDISKDKYHLLNK